MISTFTVRRVVAAVLQTVRHTWRLYQNVFPKSPSLLYACTLAVHLRDWIITTGRATSKGRIRGHKEEVITMESTY